MAGEYGLKLAVDIITSHFGHLVAKVCSCLLRRGSISLPEIARFTDLSISQVKNCILVLIQHNCVQAFSVPRQAGREIRSMTLYMAIFDNIIHRNRFSKFLGIIRNDRDIMEERNPNTSIKLNPKLSKDPKIPNKDPKIPNDPKSQCDTLLEGLLQNGRLTFEQLVMRESSTQGKATIHADFNRLVHARYVERCPKSEPFFEPILEDRASRKRRAAKAAEPIPTMEQQAMMAAALSDAERFCGITDIGAHTTQGAKATDCYSSAGVKRKYEALEIDEEDHAAITEGEVLWRANFEKFVYCLKKKVCVANVASRLGSDAGIVLEALIESSTEEKVKVTSSIDDILARSRKKKGDTSMKLEDIRIILEQLGCRLCAENNGAMYSIDLNDIIKDCQNDEVEAIVSNKYGKDAYRIFRLLAKDGLPFETNKVSEITFLEKVAAHKILYRLLMDDYLFMESSYAIGREPYFFWRLKSNALPKHIVNDMYHAVLNLSQKSVQIATHIQEALLVREKQEELLKNIFILESSLLKIDDVILIFNGVW